MDCMPMKQIKQENNSPVSANPMIPLLLNVL